MHIYVYIVYSNTDTYIYAIRKTMCPPGYHQNSSVVTHLLRHMMYGYDHLPIYLYIYNMCMHIYIYIHIYIYTCNSIK